jgi:hypothetical protein
MSIYKNRRYRYEGEKLVTRWDRVGDPGWKETKVEALELATAPAPRPIPKGGYGGRRVKSK